MMFGYGATSFTWLWLLMVLAPVGFAAGALLFFFGAAKKDGAAAILDERLAQGEINQEEHAQRQAALGLAPARSGRASWGGALALVSLLALLALAGLTLTGALPRPGLASTGPGSPDFVAGTTAAPRLVRIVAGPGTRFYPNVVRIVAGETVTFEVTTMGMAVHEFMVGPAADVAADAEGTPEVADIGMMQTRSLTYTFVGPGPFSFACHAPGHYETGMRGTIEIAP